MLGGAGVLRDGDDAGERVGGASAFQHGVRGVLGGFQVHCVPPHPQRSHRGRGHGGHVQRLLGSMWASTDLRATFADERFRVQSGAIAGVQQVARTQGKRHPRNRCEIGRAIEGGGVRWEPKERTIMIAGTLDGHLLGPVITTTDAPM